MANEIIGRQEGLLALGEFLDAVAPAGRLSYSRAEAGIGKTVLWQEGVRLARDRGFRVLTARSTQSELHVAFATVGDLFAPVIEATAATGSRPAACARDCVADPAGRGSATGGAAARSGAAFGRARVPQDGPLSSSLSTMCSGSTRARRRSSGSCFAGWSASRSAFWRPCAGGPPGCRSGSTGRLRNSGDSQSSRSRSGRSTVCCGAGLDSTCRGRC